MMTITNEDNMALMARYPDKYFDLAIVDPPYGIDASEMTMGSGKHNFSKGKKWDSGVPSDDYFSELFRVSNNQIIWGGNYFKLPLNNNWIIWDKLNPNLSFSEAEMAWCSIDRNTRIFKRLSTLPDCDIKKQHPTQKPVKLYKWLLDKYAKIKCDHKHEEHYRHLCTDCRNSNVKILDTHLGSGSIAIACHDYGFDLTACELDKEYFDAAMKRINNHMAQTKLF